MNDSIRLIRKEDSDYPRRMKELGNMPGTFYLIGRLPDDEQPSAAIVGARMCSGYGKDAAYELGHYLAEHGIQVVSGLAVGVDGYAQQGALDAGGDVFAVLASGPDVCYPITNYPIYEEILKTGGVLSEHPSGTKPLGPYFPSRNRIISALSDIVIVVEARERSGSLITADFALDQGRTVLAVPGRYSDPLSFGCNRLIAQGAGIICSPETVLCELETLRHIRPKRKRPRGTAEKREEGIALSSAASSALSVIRELGEASPEVISSRLSVTVPEASSALMELVLSGKVQETGRGRFTPGRSRQPAPDI